MIRSPEQQFAIAKRLPIPELAKVLQGQSDVVDMSIAEMVLRQKTQMQKAQQGEQAAQMLAKTPKVVEQDLANAAQAMAPRTEMGIGAVPAPNMENIEQYAGGGIVAFDDGGEVKHFDGKGPSFVESSSTPFGRAYDSFSQSVGRFFYPTQEDRLRSNLKSRLSIQGGMFGSFIPQSDEARASAKALYDQIDTMNYDQLLDLDRQMQTKTLPIASKTQATGPDVKKAEDALLKQAQAIQQGKGPHDLAVQERRIADIREAEKSKPPVSSSVPQTGIAGTIPKGLLEQLFPAKKVPTVQDVIREQKAFDEAYGVDTEIYKKMRAEYEKEKLADAEARKEAGWNRLLEAGLGIMGGTSPYAFTNIGQGALPAAKGAAEDVKEFRKLDKERTKALHELNVAENTFKRTGSTAAQAKLQHAEDKFDQVNLERGKAGADIYRTMMVVNAPGADERMISRAMRDPPFAAALEKYKTMGLDARGEYAIVQNFLKMNPMEKELLRTQNPEQYRWLEMKARQLLTPSLVTTPGENSLIRK